MRRAGYQFTDTRNGVMVARSHRGNVNVLCIDDAELLEVADALRAKHEEREAKRRADADGNR